LDCERTCEGRSKDKGIGFADFSHYDACPVNSYAPKIKSTLRAIVLMVFDLNPFKPVTLFSAAKNRVTRKMPPLLNFLTAQKSLF
jgi:hypothetical protein